MGRKRYYYTLPTRSCTRMLTFFLARLIAVLGSRVVHSVQDLLAGVCQVVQQQNQAHYVPPPKMRPGTASKSPKNTLTLPPPPDLSAFMPAIRAWIESIKIPSGS